MDDEAIDPAMMWFASMYKQAEGAMVVVVDQARKAGVTIADHVLAVIDTTHRNSWLVARDLGAEASAEGQGWIALVPRATASVVMRRCGGVEWADLIDSELAHGEMRVLFASGTKSFCSSMPAFPVLPATGSA